MGSARRHDLTGQRFHRLVVMELSHIKRQAFWRCLCDCGTVKVVPALGLKNGSSRSCGCLKHETLVDRITSHGLHRHRFYMTWLGMMSRCYNDNHNSYFSYGGAGIRVCDEWHDVRVFVAWCEKNAPDDKSFTLDRHPNPAGDYSPENCRFASKHDQASNRRTTVWMDTEDGRVSFADFVRKYGVVSYSTAVKRTSAGWDRVAAATTPLIF